MIENHSLVNELPDHKETIHTLKMHDAHFAKIFDEYHAVDKAIHRIEQGVENTSDEYLESLKVKRLHAKDTLFGMIQKSETA